MLFIERPETDPYFNLAAEEYIFRTIDDEVIMLWRNSAAVIVGKHQNPHAEVNIPYARENSIPVIRRISGGGTVYHDPGNLNFTFIRYAGETALVNYRAFLEPLSRILNEWSVPCELSGKSDLLIHDRKISGNSKHVFRNKVLHHGTLLFSSELECLYSILESRHDRYRDKSVRSKHSEVANIIDYLKDPLTIEQFHDHLAHELITTFAPVHTVRLSASDKDRIADLAEKKYKTWAWNYGYSPAYTLVTTLSDEDLKIPVEMSVVEGKIREIRTFATDYRTGIKAFLDLLIGLPHDEAAIREYLLNHPVRLIGSFEYQDELIKQLF